MTNHSRRPRDRRGLPGPVPELEIDLGAVYEESLSEVDADWLDRYGEADWYAAITLFGLFTVGDDTPLEDIPEEYRWKGVSHRYPNQPKDAG